ncbi:dynein intermediate chain 1, axonemal, partial [Trichonephila clavata]
ELNEEFDMFLTCYNPYMSQNSVEFDVKTKSYKPIPEFRRPVFYYRNLGASKPKMFGRYGVFYEVIPVNGEEKMKNKFNFRNVASQTEAVNPKDQNEYIDPNLYPVLKFSSSVTKEAILEAYLEDQFHENCRKYLRLCERMLDQNTTVANLDYDYYDNPNDQFRPNVGSLLPLWKLSLKDTPRSPVTSLSWNTYYTDLFAIGFRERRDDKNEDDDDLGLMREKGCVCILSLKGPSYPEKIYHCLCGVTSVAFHPSDPRLVAVGFAGGTLAIYDLMWMGTTPRGLDTKFKKCYHFDLVGDIKWLPDKFPQKFCSVSLDGKIISWLFLLNDLFSEDTITTLRLKDRSIETPPKGMEMKLEPSKTIGENLGLNSTFFFLV